MSAERIAALTTERGGKPAWFRPPAPYQPGNWESLTHGATSPRMVRPIAEWMAAEVVADAPWTAGAAFAPTVASWSWAEAQAVLLRTYIDEHGILDDEGEERSACRRLDAVENRAAKLRAELGLTPMTMARLLSTLASIDGAAVQGGLDALKAQGRQIAAAAEQRALKSAREVSESE